MPELPEVETITRMLRPMLLGRTIESIQLNREDIVQILPASLTEPGPGPLKDNREDPGKKSETAAHGEFLSRHLTGRRILDIHRRAKRIVFTLDDGNRIYIHLGMSGRLSLQHNESPLAPHTHFIARFGEDELRFVDPRRFGGIFWLGDDETAVDEGLGPEPLTLRPAQLLKRLSGTSRAIKSALMDQSVIAGLGNIYVDESLFDAGIHPLAPAHRLSAEQIKRLSRSIKQVLRRALRHRGSTLRDYRDANGERGNFQSLHRVYQREKLPCPICRTPIRRLVITGRSTHFCGKCQKRT